MPKGAKGHVGTKDSEDKQARKDIGNRKDMESKKENRKRGGIRNRWHALQYSLVPSVRPSICPSRIMADSLAPAEGAKWSSWKKTNMERPP